MLRQSYTVNVAIRWKIKEFSNIRRAETDIVAGERKAAMEITNEVMFYGGIILAAMSGFIMLIYLLTAKMRKMKLELQLDQEYGKSGKDKKCQK